MRVCMYAALAFLVLALTGCDCGKKPPAEQAETVKTDTTKKLTAKRPTRPAAAAEVIDVQGNHKVIRTTTVTERREDLVPPPPVLRTTVTQTTHTDETVDGIAVQPEVDSLHEKPTIKGSTKPDVGLTPPNK